MILYKFCKNFSTLTAESDYIESNHSNINVTVHDIIQSQFIISIRSHSVCHLKIHNFFGDYKMDQIILMHFQF